ncbi:DUF1996 domain-containing protein [Streptomyces sp. NPDC059168]|uniref:DUF1996 domain-containing protein n=1 Tax=Streptomyces sp. NPDC059168 TaxID=3346753 RepID=UPI00367C9868
MLGGGGLVAANVYASATEGGWGGGSGQEATGQVRSAGMATIDCPDVGSRLTSVPDGARAEVDRELAQLDQQTATAYRQLQAAAQEIGKDPSAADGSIMNPLKEKRAATIERVAVAIDRVGDRPEGLESLAACALRPGAEGGTAGTGQVTASPGAGGQGQGGAGQAGTGQGGNGPVASDYADITAARPDAPKPQQGDGASRGTFTTECGVNANGLFNSDNIIVAPGVANGAHHFHDYVGNQSNTALASDDDLAKADTSCVDKGDRSTYYWPVVRLQNGKQERDAGAPGGGTEGNAGQIVTPKDVTLTFVGSPRGKVTAMPRLLRIITGDAKAFVNGPGNANASWSCTGFEDRQLKDKYPLCPSGSDVVRTFRFQSCWDGRNIDSANHRTHVAFATPDGACPAGFQAIPQLVQRIVYDVKAPSLNDGGRTVPLFAVDSFPEQLHKPVTDHGDFINVFDEDLMREMVDCINAGRTCGARGDGSGATAAPDRSPGTGATDAPGTGATAAPASSAPAGEPRTEATTSPANNTKHSGPARDGKRTQPAEEEAKRTEPAEADAKRTEPARQDERTEPAGGGGSTGSAAGGQETDADPAAPAGSGGTGEPAPATGTASAPANDDGGAGRSQEDRSADAQSQTPVAQTEPQAAGQGGLAETGADLWPAGIGILLALGGLFMLVKARRLTR